MIRDSKPSAPERFDEGIVLRLVFPLFLLVVLVTGAAFSISSMRRSLLPVQRLHPVTITVNYPGASLTETEVVCKMLEESTAGLANLQTIRTLALPERAEATLFPGESDNERFLQNIRSIVAEMHDLPAAVEAPRIHVEEPEPATSLAVSGPMSEPDLRVYCEQIKQRILQSGIAHRAEIRGPGRTLLIEIPRIGLFRHGIDIPEIAGQMQRRFSSQDLGTVRIGETSFRLSLNSGSESWTEAADFEIALPDGSLIPLRELNARIGLEASERVILNGKHVGLLVVRPAPDEDPAALARSLAEFALEEQRKAPPGVDIRTVLNSAETIGADLGGLLLRGVIGFSAALLILALFTSPLVMPAVAAAVLICSAGGIILMHALGMSWNVLSLTGAFLGAALILERIEAWIPGKHASTPPPRISRKKTLERLVPDYLVLILFFGSAVVFSKTGLGRMLLDAFAAPMLFLTAAGVTGFAVAVFRPDYPSRFFSVRPTRTEADSEDSCDMPDTSDAQESSPPQASGTARALVQAAPAFLGLMLSGVVLAAGLFFAGLLGRVELPMVESSTIEARFIFAPDVSAERMERIVRRSVSALSEADALQKESTTGNAAAVKSVLTVLPSGDSPEELREAVITARIDRRVSTPEKMLALWRTMQTPSMESYGPFYSVPPHSPAKAIGELGLRLSAENRAALLQATLEVKKHYYAHDAVYNVRDDMIPTGSTLRILPKSKDSEESGRLVQQLQSGFSRYDAGYVRIGKEGFPLKLAARPYMHEDISRYPVPTDSGTIIGLGDAARIVREDGATVVPRLNGRPAVTVSADVDENAPTSVPKRLDAHIARDLGTKFPDVEFTQVGAEHARRSAGYSLLPAIPAGLALLLLLLVLYDRDARILVPVLASLPAVIIGVFLAHLLTFIPVSPASLCGVVPVLCLTIIACRRLGKDYFSLLASGAAGDDAAANALSTGFQRLRPSLILFVVALLPLAFTTAANAGPALPFVVTTVIGAPVAVILGLPCAGLLCKVLYPFHKKTEAVVVAEESQASE